MHIHVDYCAQDPKAGILFDIPWESRGVSALLLVYTTPLEATPLEERDGVSNSAVERHTRGYRAINLCIFFIANLHVGPLEQDMTYRERT